MRSVYDERYGLSCLTVILSTLYILIVFVLSAAFWLPEYIINEIISWLQAGEPLSPVRPGETMLSNFIINTLILTSVYLTFYAIVMLINEYKQEVRQ